MVPLMEVKVQQEKLSDGERWQVRFRLDRAAGCKSMWKHQADNRQVLDRKGKMKEIGSVRVEGNETSRRE